MTPKEREVMKLALEALQHSVPTNSQNAQEQLKAITAIKEALANHTEGNLAMVAQPAVTESHKQEPVACVAEVSTYDGYLRKEVVWNKRIDSFSLGTRFYTIPPQRTWVGLTLDELIEISKPFEGLLPEGWMKLTSAIEAKLKAKNSL